VAISRGIRGQQTGTFHDTGRFNVTKMERDRGAFKTPPLREVALRAPYMHDGSIGTLREVIEFYNRGGNRNPQLDSRITPLKLTASEIDALVRLMEALSGEGYQDTAPRAFPRVGSSSN
jgi:cytochrome c peroxidase